MSNNEPTPTFTEAHWTAVIAAAALAGRKDTSLHVHADALWDLSSQVEMILHPENFEDHPDADPYDEEGNPDAEAHWTPLALFKGCECEIDWDCGCGASTQAAYNRQFKAEMAMPDDYPF